MKQTYWWTMALAAMMSTPIGAQERSVIIQNSNGPAIEGRIPEPAAGAQQADLPLPIPPADNRAAADSSAVAYLGVTFDPQIRDAAVARSVHFGSPADQAGLRPGDAIEALNGRPVRSSQEVLDMVGAMRPGAVVDIDYSRRITGRTQVALDSRPVPGAQQSQLTGEFLPVPPNARRRIEANRPAYDTNAARQNQSGAATNGRRADDERSDRSVDRDRGYRFRGLFPRRRD